MNIAKPTSGIVLLLVLGVLGLLSVLAVTFVSLARLERGISMNYMARVRATLAAESGVEAAVARLSALPVGAVPTEEFARMAYSFEADSKATFPEYPSFNADVTGDGVPDNVSGLIDGDLTTGISYSLKVEDASGKLNINDSNGLVNWDDDYLYDTLPPLSDPPRVDDPNPEDDNLAKPRRLYQILERLGENLFGDPEVPTGIGALLASTLMDGREGLPGGKFTSYSQVRELLLNSPSSPVLTEAQYKELLQHVTLYSWRDPNVLKPTFKFELTIPWQGYISQYVPSIASEYVFLWKDMQSKFFELEPRSPVNVNSASKELLEALIAPIQGWTLIERFESSSGPVDSLGSVNNSNASPQMPFDWVEYAPWYYASPTYLYTEYVNSIGRAALTPKPVDPAAIAEALWNRVHVGEDLNNDGEIDPDKGDVGPRSFSTWEELDDFLRNEAPREAFGEFPGDIGFDHLGFPSVNSYIHSGSQSREEWVRSYFHDMLVDAVLANFDPNSRLRDYNPNRSSWRHVDKNHLANYTTEFTLEPTGVYEIESRGVVRNNAVVASTYDVACSIKMHETLKISTQAQFMEGTPSAAEAAQLLGASTGDTGTLWGATTMSYPEPLPKDGAPYLSPFDGSISLATWNPALSEMSGDPSFAVDYQGQLKPRDLAPGGNDRMWTLNASIPVTQSLYNILASQGITQFPPGSAVPVYESRINLLPETALTRPASDPGAPGILYADGAFSCIGNVINYDARNLGGLDGRTGAIMFWLKPVFHTGLGGRPHKLFTFYNRRDFSGQISPRREVAIYYFPHTDSNADFYQAYQDDTRDSNPNFIWGEPKDWNWIPHHSMIAHWRMGGPRWMMRTPSLSHDTPMHDLASDHDDLLQELHLEHHAWNHVGFSWEYYHIWDMVPQDPSFPVAGPKPPGAGGDADIDPSVVNQADDGVLCINGKRVGSEYADVYNFDDADLHHIGDPPDGNLGTHKIMRMEYLGFQSNVHQDPPRLAANNADRYIESQAYFRLGDVNCLAPPPIFITSPSAISGSCAYSADCTYANIVGFQARKDADVFQEEWDRGRFYNGVDAVYTSPVISVFDHLNLGPGDASSQVQLRSVSWTLQWGRNNRDGGALRDSLASKEINPNDPFDPMLPEGWDPLVIDIEHPKLGWLYEAYPDLQPSYAGGSSIRLDPATGAPVRLRKGESLRFRCRFNLIPGQAIYESPVLDDITFTFALVKPEVLFWAAA